MTNNPLLADLEVLEHIIREFEGIQKDFEASKSAPYSKDFRRLFLRKSKMPIQRLADLIVYSASQHYHTDFGFYVGSFIDRSMIVKLKRWQLLVKGIRTQNEKYFDEADILERRFNKINGHIQQTFKNIAAKTTGATQSSDSESVLFNFSEGGGVNGR